MRSQVVSSKTISELLDTTFRAVLQRRKNEPDSDRGKHAVGWTRPPVRNGVAYDILTFVPLAIIVYLFCEFPKSSSPTYIMTFLSGRRCRSLTLETFLHMNYIRLLVLSSYLLAIAFSVCSAGFVLHGISDFDLCRSAIYVCIGFLFTGKTVTQLFLIERAHVANINYIRRRDDPIWWISMGTSALAGISLTVWTYKNPVYYMSVEDGRCRKGLPPNVVGPIQAYEILLNLVLTVTFVRMLQRSKKTAFFAKPEKVSVLTETFKKAARKVSFISDKRMEVHATEQTIDRMNSATTSIEMAELPSKAVTTNINEAMVVLPAITRPSKLRNLAMKSLIGTLAMLMWSIASNTIFYVTRGRENAWLCFIQCNIDGKRTTIHKKENTELTPSLVILSVTVLHWLTSDHKDEDSNSATALRPVLATMPTYDSAAGGFTVGRYAAGMDIPDDETDIEEGSHSTRPSSSAHRIRDSWISGEVVQLPKHALVKAYEKIFSPRCT